MRKLKCRVPQRTLALLFGLILSLGTFAQSFVAKGVVKDATGEPVIGATVRVPGVQGGAITDFDGNFQINCNKGQMLEITYIGMETQQAAASENMSITLKEDAGQSLNEVVVIGYGVAKKNDLTGSVTAIKPDEKNHGLQVSAQDMIQGKIAGVNVNSASGAPGDGAQIRIRGGASLNASNDPLIVIDGLAMDNNSTKGMANPLSLVNPNDIETFTVLKDASATAIYGSRGSNGVIIITTKKGRKNQSAQVSYNGNVSFSSISKKLNVMNAAEYVDHIKNYYGAESAAYQGLGWKEYNADGTPNYAAGTYDTNWQDEIYRTAVSSDHNVTVAGSAKNMPYRFSAGFTDQNGILKGSNYQRATVGFNLNPSLFNDHLNMNINAKYAYSHTRRGGDGAIGAAISMDPTRPVTSTDKKYDNWEGYWQWTKETTELDPTYRYARNDDAPRNPVELINHYNNKSNSHVVIGNFEADYKIHGFEDLRLHLNLAGEYAYGGDYTKNNAKSTYGFYYGGSGDNTEKKYNITATAYLQYYKDFNEKHHFDIMAGYEYSHLKYWGNSEFTDYYPSTNQSKYDDGTPKAGTVNSHSEAYWRGQMFLVSWMGRANYTLLDRYLFTVTARYDGSSRFAKGKKWGFFPSAAFAWRIKDEAFLRDSQAVSDLKLRLGWGNTGQQDTGMEYYTAAYKKSTTTDHLYPVGPDNDGTLYKPLTYNNDLTWETTMTLNVGLDYGMFNQRLTLNVDAYYRKTTDLLCRPTIPTGQNFDNQMALNAGSLQNKGVEIAISGKPVQTKNWFLDLGVNVAYNQNEITELYGGKDVISGSLSVGQNKQLTYHKVGKPANSFWVYQQVYDQNGRPIMGCYVDRNADGIIDDNDRYFYKNIAAPWTGGFYLKISYKNWDLGTNFRGSIGNYVYNGIEQGKVNSDVLYNPKGYYENSTKDIVKLGWTSYNYDLSDYFVQNGSYLKCDNITLGYNFNNLFKGGNYSGINGRLYASCSNVFTITKYKGLDPEQNSGFEGSVYPRSRTFLIGLNLNF
ncbi:MAG: TonB-dependent receptor [Bacteroidaceae bacterium]|nr:TonB-dependent receptor [Bacteroidaceae bacterium]